jgi:ankyrin repeat protein
MSKLLHTAVESGQTIVLELLVEFGAKPDGYNKEGFTPLHLAVKKNKEDHVKILIKGGAIVGFLIMTFFSPISHQKTKSTTDLQLSILLV